MGKLTSMLVGLATILSATVGFAAEPERPLRLDTVRFAGDTTLVLTPGTVFDEATTTPLLEDIIAALRDRGYLYAAARTTGVSRTGSSARLELELTKGPRVICGSVRVNGLTRSRPDLVRRYLRGDDGEVCSSRFLTVLEADAARVPFVTFVPPAVVKPRPGYTSADVELNFREKTPVTIEGSGGYVPDGAGVVWSLDLALASLFGGGRAVRLRSERRERGRNLLDIEYRQPAFLLGPGSWSVTLASRDYRAEFYEFSVATGYETRLGRDFSAALDLGWKDVDPTEAAPSYSRYSLGLSISRRLVSDPLNPRSGYSVDWRLTYGYRCYRADSAAGVAGTALNETRAELRTEWFVPLVGGALVRLGATYSGLETEQDLPPLPELVLVGGPPNLRGYRNEQFAAVRAATVTVEPRYRFAQGCLFAFADAAYINNRESDAGGRIATREDYHWSYGVGLALVSAERSLMLSLGFNPDTALDEPRLSVQLTSSL